MIPKLSVYLAALLIAAFFINSCLGLGLENHVERQHEQDAKNVQDLSVTGDETTTSKFFQGFTASFSLILATEVGDKTFFIAVVLAMRHRRRTILIGALGALYVMTIVSAFVGQVLTILPVMYTHVGVILLLVYFGVVLLREAFEPDDGESEFDKLQEEVVHDLDTMDQKKFDLERNSSSSPQISHNKVSMFEGAERAILLQAFTLTFFAEWGDRSQIATIALAAAYPVSSVVLGGCIGHSLCTAAAVLSGRFLKSYISEKTVALLGGSTFLLFAIFTYVQGP